MQTTPQPFDSGCLVSCRQAGALGRRPRLTGGLARLDALNMPPLTEDEVAEEVQAARRERHAGQGS